MTDIDRARKIAGFIKNGFIIADPYCDARILAAGFLALDKLLETHPPTEKPQKYLSVLVKMREDDNYHIGYQVGCWDHDEVWTVCDSIYKSDDIEYWRHLSTADKR